jgi:hypothetical protein
MATVYLRFSVIQGQEVPYFFILNINKLQLSNTWVRYGHICSLFFDIVGISVQALIIVVDQRVKSLVVK